MNIDWSSINEKYKWAFIDPEGWFVVCVEKPKYTLTVNKRDYAWLQGGSYHVLEKFNPDNDPFLAACLEVLSPNSLVQRPS